MFRCQANTIRPSKTPYLFVGTTGFEPVPNLYRFRVAFPCTFVPIFSVACKVATYTMSRAETYPLRRTCPFRNVPILAWSIQAPAFPFIRLHTFYSVHLPLTRRCFSLIQSYLLQHDLTPIYSRHYSGFIAQIRVTRPCNPTNIVRRALRFFSFFQQGHGWERFTPTLSSLAYFIHMDVFAFHSPTLHFRVQLK